MLFLLDTFSILYRLFYALPELSHNNLNLNSIYGLTRVLIKITKEYKVEYLTFCVDKGRSGRDKIQQTYKSDRVSTPDKFKQQIPIFYELSKASKISILAIEGMEADDTIYTISNLFKKEIKIYIITGDSDLLQAIDDNVTVLLMKKGISDIEVFDKINFTKKYGFDSSLYIYYKALVGDQADNIKGVKGIGPKKALNIIKSIENPSDIPKHLDSQQLEIFNHNCQIIQLKNSPDRINLSLEKLKIDRQWYKNKDFVDFLRKYNFRSILKEIGVEDVQMKLFG
ncbi:MAG: 5'-3' exonuclease H3TH domain-containing protein [bacterium]